MLTVGYNYTVVDPGDANVSDLASAWKLPNSYISVYPDFTRIDLTGYKTGPSLLFSTNFSDGTYNFNTISQIPINFNIIDSYEQNIQFMQIVQFP